MKNLVYPLLAFICLFFQNGCDVTDHIEDPTRLSDVELRLILPTAISQSAYNQQAFSARLAGSYMQYWTGFDGPVTLSDYRLQPGFLNNIWSDGLYGGSLKDCQLIIEKAIDEGMPHYEAIGSIMMANELWHTTLMFGDIPYSNAFMGGKNLMPDFDKQEDVMQAISQLLDDALVLLKNERTLGSPASDDLVFGGDASAWIRTAWALKARFHTHMSKRDGQAAQKVLDAIDQGAISSLSEQPNFKWGISENEAQPLARFGQQRPNTLVMDDRFPEKFLADDPRRDVYSFFDGTSWLFYHETLHWAQAAAHIPFISYVEVAFMEAEALWRTQAPVAQIQESLAKGITASMEQVGLQEMDYEPYLAALTPLADLSRTQQLEQIMNEAYKAYYGFATHISWANYRRTGYPNLTPHPRGSYSLNPAGGIPKRFVYPENESINNPENVAAAKEAQEGALLDVPLWIYQN